MGHIRTKPTSTLQIVEEVFNGITHGAGALLGAGGLLLGLLTLRTSTSYLVGFIIYASSLILLMSASTMYHALMFTRAAGVFKTLDHGGIFLLIAGSYTPFIMALFRGWVQITYLAIIWSLAAIGITFAATLRKMMARFEVAIYVIMGWLALAFIPKLSSMPREVVWLTVSGGVLYTLGALFQPGKKPFHHVVWHVFVIAAACLHFVAIIKLA